MPNGVINLLPWGGPIARLLAVEALDANELLIRLLPLMLTGLLSTFAMAAFAGMKERKRLGIVDMDFEAKKIECSCDELALKRPKYIWFNLILTSKVINHNAEGIVHIALMILGAGILMGILSESGMASAMAERLIVIIPESWGSMFNLIIAIISGPAVCRWVWLP